MWKNMAIHDILLVLKDYERYYFPPDFKEYILNHQLKFSQWYPGWVFWSEQDHETEPTLPLGNDNIRLALEKLVKNSAFDYCLVQFWAPSKTLEGRTLLTTQFQPFAFCATYNKDRRHRLCEYRMTMCRDYKFYADADSGEELLGLPGRVFLHQFPEFTPHVKYYSTKEFPQLHLALRCGIHASCALPVFDQSCQCVGVLELASLDDSLSLLYILFAEVNGIFQKFGLQCFTGFECCRMQIQYKGEKKAAFEELNMVLGCVTKIHKLPVAVTWVPCSGCTYLGGRQHLYKGEVIVLPMLEEEEKNPFSYFLFLLENSHLRKGKFAGRILEFPNLLCCSDIKQFSIAEYPLVPFARQNNLSGWFTMRLQSSYTGSEVYELEFFLPASSKDNENILTTISLILGTMELNFTTFKLVSGQELGEVLSVEVINFLNDQKSQSVRKIQATRFAPSPESSEDGGVILQQGQLDQPTMDAKSSAMNVVSEEQIYPLPSIEALQNGEVTTQLNSFDQPSLGPLNNGQNVITAEQNIFIVGRSEGGKRKTQRIEQKKTGVKIDVPLEEILKCSKMKRGEIAKELKVSISTFKRVCRDYGINRWPPRDVKKTLPFRPLPVEHQGQIPRLNSDLPSHQASASVAHIKASFQDADMVTIRAEYGNDLIKFRLSLSSTLVELQQEVYKRLELEAGTYKVKYKDEENKLILIACDEDLQDCIRTSRSLGNTSIMVLLELKQPITNLNSAN